MMSTLFVNARFLTQPVSGTQRYAMQLLDALDSRLSDRVSALKIVALVPSAKHRSVGWRNIELRQAGFFRGHLWEQTELAWAARDGWLLNLVSAAPLIHSRQIVTLHDAALSDHSNHFSRSYRLVHGTIRPRIARAAKRIITVSEFSRDALSHALGVAERKFAVIPNGSDHLLMLPEDEDMLQRRGLEQLGYVLFVGNEAPHKNVRTALAAFAAMNHPTLAFVTVGIGRSTIFGEVTALRGENVRRLQDVNDVELRALYKNAALLIFPSRYEGFGIPPVEAMSLGCPVVASDAASIPEVVGDAGLLVDPDDVDGMAAAMTRVINDPQTRQRLIASGHRRAERFTWAEAARTLEELLMELPGLREGRPA